MALSPVASFFRTQGLAIIASHPLWAGRGLVDDKLHEKVEGYNHEITADGGYWSCTMPMKAQPEVIEDWFEHGLGRHIEVRDEAGGWVWNGFINQVEAGVSTLTARRGPMIEVANRVKVAYQTISYDTIPPIPSYPAVTALAQDSQSQVLYAIQEEIISGGEMTAGEAEQLRDTHLADRAWPEMTNDLDLSGANEAIARLECVGFSRLLGRYGYNQIAATGTENASTKIQSVLTADPNGLYTNFKRLEANTYQVKKYESESRRADAIIEEVVAFGDSNHNRWTFGVYENRVPVYAAVPATIEYFEKVRSSFLQLERADTGIVYPWNVRPARWLQISDWLAGGNRRTSQLRRDPRNQFIESVRYSAPWMLIVNGGRLNRIDQYMAKVR